MDTFEQSQIFFFISSVGFVVLWILAGIFLFYLIRVTKTFSRLLEKLEKDIERVGDTTEELLEQVRDNAIFRFFFGAKKKSRKRKNEKK